MATETATRTTITMPQLGESVTEGTIGTWLKQVGDRVEKYEPLVEVVTDKVNAEIPAPVGGTLVAILVDPDTTVPVGAGLCLIDEADGAASTEPLATQPHAAETTGGAGPTSSPAAASDAPAMPSNADRNGIRRKGEIADEATLLRARSSPAVRRIAEEHGIDLGQVAGTGIHGRVTKRDILDHLDHLRSVPSTSAAPAAPVAPPPAPAALAQRPPSGAQPALQLFPGDEIVRLTPMRRAVAEHMVRSERTAPHVTVVMEVDMTRVVAYRAARKDEFKRREGIDLTYLPFAIKAATAALRDHPRLNAAWDEEGESIIQRGAIHVGVAVGLDDGLVVPVIKHADRLSLAGLAHAVRELAAKARAGTLSPDDVAGGTFTINNPGTFGSLVSTPILVQPQAAILSTEAIVKRPVVVDDMIGIRSMMNLSLSIDHRVLDGLAAARFLQQVKAWLERVDEGFVLS